MSVRVFQVNGLCVDVKYIVVGMLENNVYVISDDKGTMVVDPSDNLPAIMELLDGVTPDVILVTHHHNDHTGALAALRQATGAKVVASAIDAERIEHPVFTGITQPSDPCPVDVKVNHGDVVEVGDMKWKIILTPGHTRGGICAFMIPQFGKYPDGLPVVITGDTLFAGTIGRTDFEGGSMDDMRASIKKLAALPDDTAVLPGHNDLTTIGAERRRVFARFGDEPEDV